MDQSNELENTFIEEYKAALLLLDRQMNKPALILLSKSLFALIDFIIFKKYNKLPKNHSDRFRFLENKEKELYVKLNEIWNIYTDSYSKPSSEESIKDFKECIKFVIEKNETSEKIKKIIEE